MSQTYYLWTSYKGITNRCDTNSGNTFKKWIQLLHRSEGRGNQNYYTGKIGHVTYNGFQVLDEDFYNENSGIPEGRFLISIPSASDSSTQNLTASARSSRLSMSSFNAKDGLTDEEKANFYGDFAISRGFNREYGIKTSVELDSLSQSVGTESTKQAKVSINDDGNYVNVADGEFKIRFSRNDENPFEGIGCLFGFMTWPFKEQINYPYMPDKAGKDFVLKCFFDEDVTDLDSSHFAVTNCTITEARKITAKEYWVIFQINEPATGEWTIDYTITLIKDKVTAVNDTNKKNRTHSITYTLCVNNGKFVFYNHDHTGSGNKASTNHGETFQSAGSIGYNTNKGVYKVEFIGYKFIGRSGSELWESLNGYEWTRMFGGGHYFNTTDFQYATGNSGSNELSKLVSGRDGSGNNLIIAITEEKKMYYSRDGGYNWFKYDSANNYRERQYGTSGLGTDPNTLVLGLAYSEGTWIICGENSKIKYSNDGYNFTDTGVDIDGVIFRDVIFHIDRFIIVGRKNDFTGYVGYSTDKGLTWTFDTSQITNIQTTSHYYGGAHDGPFKLVSDNSGTVIAISEHNNNAAGPPWDTGRVPIWYSHDSGVSWTYVRSPGDRELYYPEQTVSFWNGHRFFLAWRIYSRGSYTSWSTDAINWTTPDNGQPLGYPNARYMWTNYYNSGETPYSDVDGILKVTVSELMSITDISLNYFPAELVPQAWWENMLSDPLKIEERKKENDTRRNYLFKKIFEANQTITYFDISTNIINMPENTIKDSLRVYKLNNKTFSLNLHTNTDINKELGYYVALENDNDKIEFTNTTNDISFNLIRTGVDSDGYALYDIVKTGGTSNFVIDF
tara:strand:- start:12460 stop:14991 length:2532 start_codon:yes stop_codon:yes gene_type:complete